MTKELNEAGAYAATEVTKDVAFAGTAKIIGSTSVTTKQVKLKPGQKLGGSGKAISPTVKHSTRKRVLDAAQAETAKGRAPAHNKAKGDKPPHFHGVDSKGDQKPTHHDYPE